MMNLSVCLPDNGTNGILLNFYVLVAFNVFHLRQKQSNAPFMAFSDRQADAIIIQIKKTLLLHTVEKNFMVYGCSPLMFSTQKHITMQRKSIFTIDMTDNNEASNQLHICNVNNTYNPMRLSIFLSGCIVMYYLVSKFHISVYCVYLLYVC